MGDLPFIELFLGIVFVIAVGLIGLAISLSWVFLRDFIHSTVPSEVRRIIGIAIMLCLMMLAFYMSGAFK